MRTYSFNFAHCQKKTLVFFLLLIGFFITEFTLFAKSEEVIAVGRAKIFGENYKMAEDQALSNAMRNAVEQSMGVLLDAKTVVENWRIIQDNIYTETTGYITSYEILRNSQDESKKTWQVTIKAFVSNDKLKGKLDALKLLHNKSGNPRYSLIYFQESEKSYPPQSDPVIVASNSIKSVLARSGFRFFLASYNPDINQLLSNQRKSNIDYVLLYEVVPNYPQSSGQYGLKPISVSIRINLYHTETRELITVRNKSLRSLTNASQGSPAWTQALNNSADKTGASIAGELIEDISLYYQNLDISGEIFTLILTELSEYEEQNLLNLLRNIDGFKSLRELKKVKGLLSVEYRSLLKSDQLRSLILILSLDSGLNLETVSASDKRFVFKKNLATTN